MKMRRIKFTLIYIALIAMSIYGVCGGLHKNDLAGAIGIASMFCLVFITTGLYFEITLPRNPIGFRRWVKWQYI